MKTYIQILGTAGTDNTPSFLIFFDNARYLFGCGEGTQRFFFGLIVFVDPHPVQILH
jgi:hypothetical protein